MSVPNTPKEFFDLLVRASEDNRLPATGTDEFGYKKCCYRTCDGRACAIGLLIPDEETANGIPNEMPVRSNSWAQKFLPPWLSLDDAQKIQKVHDVQQCSIWNHDKFAVDLKEIPVFTNCNFEETS